MNDLGHIVGDRAGVIEAPLHATDGLVLNRAGRFAWLAGLFSSPPGLAEVCSCRDGSALALFQDVAADTNLAAAVRDLRAVLALPSGDEQMTSLIGISYGKLFLGIGGPDAVPPYESAHRFGNRLFQLPVAEMQDLLDAHGLVVAAGCSEPPDHLAIELTLLSRLIFSRHPDQALLVSRLQRWVPSFAERCAEHDELGFWAATANLLNGLLNRETDGSCCRDETPNC